MTELAVVILQLVCYLRLRVFLCCKCRFFVVVRGRGGCCECSLFERKN
jgi:hypothetical protein